MGSRFRKRNADRIAAKRRTDAYREYNRMRAHLRRAQLAKGSFTLQDWRRILAVFDHACAYCRRDDVKMTIDHFIPLARGGRHDVSNVVPACGPCNSSKNDSDPFDWMEARGRDGDLVVALICETRAAA